MSQNEIPPKPKDKRTKRYKEWVERYEKSSDGLGDTIEKVTKATGIDKAVKFISGEDCGCQERKSKLNHLFPYYKPNCFNEDEFDFLDQFFATEWMTRKISKEELTTLYSVYNRVFNTQDVLSACSSCVNNRVKKLLRLYQEYL